MGSGTPDDALKLSSLFLQSPIPNLRFGQKFLPQFRARAEKKLREMHFTSPETRTRERKRNSGNDKVCAGTFPE